MIDFFKNLPLRRKLIVINILIILPVIIIGTILSINIVKKSGRLSVEKQVMAFGDLTASFVVADVLFNDKESVKASLESYKNLPDVSYAAILDNELQVIASYGNIENSSINYYFDNTTSRFEDNNFLYYKSVTYKSETLGTLFIINDTNRLQEVINRIYIGIVIVGIFTFLILIFASSSIQRLVTKPISNLVNIIEEVVKTQNYSKRIHQNNYQDEISILYNNFNKMLATIDLTTVSQNYLDNIMKSLAEMVIVLDENGKINTINETVTRLTGFKIEDLKHQLPTILLEDFKELRQSDNQGIKYETIIKTQHQKNIAVSVSVTTFVNNEQRQRTILSIRDITKRKKAEEELRANFSKLEQTNTELQELSYILSHDLKAPIRGIGVLVSMMQEDFKGDDWTKDTMTDYFQLILKRIKRMNGLINGILVFSKIGRQGIEAQPIELKTLVEEVIEITVPENFSVNLPNDLPTITFNPTQAYQIFQNLIGNAVKYNDKAAGQIDVLWKDLGNKYQFIIKDNGIGIPTKYHNKIFKVFQVLESRDNVESTGIGLAIVKKIIDKSNGKIWIDSNYDVGVAFVFELPKQ